MALINDANYFLFLISELNVKFDRGFCNTPLNISDNANLIKIRVFVQNNFVFTNQMIIISKIKKLK